MQLPGAPSLVFLGYLLLFLPWAAYRSAQRLHAARAAPPEARTMSRTAIWKGTLLSQGLLLALAWYVGRGFGFDVFAVPGLGARDFACALAALGACLVLRQVSRALRTEAEKRDMIVFYLAPRTPAESALRTATVLLASVAEEAAYRGTGMAILWYALGDPWIAAGICCLAFALAHWAQGWKSGAVVFAIAAVMHGLVALTGTLVLAMAVHAVYDFVAGARIRREALAKGYGA